MQKISSIIIGVAIVVGGGAFYGGMKYAQSKAAISVAGVPGGTRMRGDGTRGGFGGQGGELVAGEIISRDEKSVSIKLRDGGSRIVFLSDKTTVAKMVDGTNADLVVGKTVTVMGSANSDGSITAQSIQLRNPMTPPPATGAKIDKQFTITAKNFSFSLATMSVKKGDRVRITIKNEEGVHDLKLDEFNVASARLQSGDETAVEFTADKTGSSEYYCSIGSHRAMGMKGTLMVE